MNVLVINAGSSSLKYQLLNPETEVVLAKGLCERIGIDGQLTHKMPGKEDYHAEIPMPSHSQAIKAVMDALLDSSHGAIKSLSEIDAIGHRVVHGGEFFSDSVLIEDDVIQAIEDCVPLAPLHNPANLTGYRACVDYFGKALPQVAVFDTAFHHTMPPKAYIYALPYEYYEKYKVRKYGFHGTSHRYVSQRAAKFLNRPVEELKLISCHLGNGSSVCAIDGGKSIDTSMGFTPLDGLPMGTRSGNIDAGIIEYIMKKENIDIEQMLNILNKHSGVDGISGISSDFRDLVAAYEEGNERAKLSLQVFNYSVKKHIGAHIAALGGLDAVIFTAGIGENDAVLRADALEGMDFFGLHIDHKKNARRGGDRVISTDDSPAKILVIPTNEELMIAIDTAEIAGKK